MPKIDPENELGSLRGARNVSERPSGSQATAHTFFHARATRYMEAAYSNARREAE